MTPLDALRAHYADRAAFRASLTVGVAVRVYRREGEGQPPTRLLAVVAYLGRDGAIVRRGAKGRGRREVYAYDDLHPREVA